ncbi:YcxB family protein [Polaromonas sp. A23]|uniref:YcxB family protein n=1 Tax=Polaromonas sp. A23 TaxID=1944133 RepID=UPI0009852ED7|nr:YcxB family protein [Polaromonas sp. A23]OOG39832.1 hypothetical protein B0B52_14505 [Polaromonas sp. A23]
MEINLRYWIGPAEYLARDELLHPEAFRTARAGFRREAVEYLIVCLFALLASWQTRETLFVLIALGFFGYKIAWFVIVQREFQKALAAAAKKQAPREIELIIDDQGLHETVEGVKSFAPWSAVKSQVRFKDTYFLALAGGLTAVVPCSALTQSGAGGEEALIAVLQMRAVPLRNGAA